MKKSVIGFTAAGVLVAASAIALLLTGQAAAGKGCLSMSGAWRGNITVTTPTGPRSFESILAFADGALTEITTNPHQDPVFGVSQVTSGLGAYKQECDDVHFTFTKYYHAADGAFLGSVTISETGLVTKDATYSGSAQIRRFKPDGTQFTDANGNPIVLTATSAYTRVVP